jgi:hypothetical protein
MPPLFATEKASVEQSVPSLEGPGPGLELEEHENVKSERREREARSREGDRVMRVLR